MSRNAVNLLRFVDLEILMHFIRNKSMLLREIALVSDMQKIGFISISSASYNERMTKIFHRDGK